MTPRARTLLILSVAAQAAVSIVQFGLPAIGLEVRDALDVGPAGFGVVFAAVGLGSAAVLLPTGHAGRPLRRTPGAAGRRRTERDRLRDRVVILGRDGVRMRVVRRRHRIGVGTGRRHERAAARVPAGEAGHRAGLAPAGGAAGRHDRRGDAAAARTHRRRASGDAGCRRPDRLHRGAVRAALAGGRRRDRRPGAGRRAVRAGHATGDGAGAALRVRTFGNAHLHRAGRPRAGHHRCPGGRAVRRRQRLRRRSPAGLGPAARTATAAPAARGRWPRPARWPPAPRC